MEKMQRKDSDFKKKLVSGTHIVPMGKDPRFFYGFHGNQSYYFL